MAVTMGCSYLCLFIRTFEAKSNEDSDQNKDLIVSKTSSKCVALASFTYFFTLSTFAWMNTMSYNIMTTFSGSRLPTHYKKRRLGLYSLYSFGIPALLTMIVGIVNKKE